MADTLRGFCLFSFSIFSFGFHGFHLKKLNFFLVVNNKDNRVFMSRNYLSTLQRIRSAREKFELTNQDPAGGKNFTVLKSM